MKTEDKAYATEIRLNEYGQVDVEYYKAKAVQMRAEYMAEMLAVAKGKLKTFLTQLLEKLIGTRAIPSH